MLIGGAAARPLAARAQQPKMRRVGVLNAVNADDPDRHANLNTFFEALARAGWVEGQNLHVELRWAGGDQSQMSRDAEQLVALAPDVLVATGTAPVPALLRATQTIGNITGFLLFEYNLSAKWLELLKEIAPSITRIAVIRDAEITAGVGQFAVIQSAASALRMNVRAISMRNAVEIERAITSFARAPNGGLILTGSALAVVHRELIISLAARYGLPAVYYRRYFVANGGLVSYGPDTIDQYRRAAEYVDRILKGEKPADLPVQAPTKYELVVNLRTAKALGLAVPPTLLARADEVIE